MRKLSMMLFTLPPPFLAQSWRLSCIGFRKQACVVVCTIRRACCRPRPSKVRRGHSMHMQMMVLNTFTNSCKPAACGPLPYVFDGHSVSVSPRPSLATATWCRAALGAACPRQLSSALRSWRCPASGGRTQHLLQVLLGSGVAAGLRFSGRSAALVRQSTCATCLPPAEQCALPSP